MKKILKLLDALEKVFLLTSPPRWYVLLAAAIASSERHCSASRAKVFAESQASSKFSFFIGS